MQRLATRNPLLIPELLDHVLDELVDEPCPVRQDFVWFRDPCRASQKTLFSLARTCHAISEPSLDRLWRALASVVPLLRLFAVVDKGQDCGKVILPSFAEWETIRRYTTRVRELCVGTDGYGGDSRSSLSLLRSILQVTPIFSDLAGPQPPRLLPNLRVLIWDVSAVHYVSMVEGLLTSGLVSLDITLDGDSDKLDSLIEHLVLLCPRIKSLSWRFIHSTRDHPNALVIAAVSSCVCRLGNLQDLMVPAPLDHVALKHLILSPNLKTLSTMLDHVSSETDKINVTCVDTPFPNVGTIEVDFWDVHFLTSLLRPHQQHFRDVSLTIHSDLVQPMAESVRICFDALATPQRVHSLESFDFELDEVDWDVLEDLELENTPGVYCITFETLSPLARFCSLQKLYISLPNQISIDDSELAALVRNWSSLEFFWLDCTSGGWPWPSAKCPTLRGLLALVKACPQLYSLQLSIDARVVPMDASPDIRTAALCDVRFSYSLIDEPPLVAEFFRKHLLSVKYLYPWTWAFQTTEYPDGCKERWMEVEELL